MLCVRDVVADGKVVSAAKVAIAFACDDDRTDVAIFPSGPPYFAEIYGVLLIYDVSSTSVGEGDDADSAFGFVADTRVSSTISDVCRVKTKKESM